MPNYQRPQIPYVPTQVWPFNDRYGLTATENQPINSNQLDGDFNYLIDSLNALYAIVQGIAAGILPGSNNPANINKFPATDGAGNIFWTQILAAYFSAQCIPTAALQPGCVTNPILGGGSVANGNIQAGAVQNNTITDNTISFDKILNENNAHFQLFFNNQGAGTLSGATLQANTVNGAALIANTLPANALVNNSITNQQLSTLVQTPVGAILDWCSGFAPPSGWLAANGQAINRVTYAALFALINVTYGTGDGVTTFNVPDLRGRTSFGVDPFNLNPTGGRILTNTHLADASGEEFHQLSVQELPSHTHQYDSVSNLSNVTPGSIPVASTHTTINTGATGGNVPHNNMPPYMLLQKIIYVGV